MAHTIRFLILFCITVFVACQGSKEPITDAQRTAIREALIAKHAEMLKSASAADADGLFSHFLDNTNGALAFDGTLTVTRESALNGLREAYSGLLEQQFVMDEEYVNVISPEAAILTGTGIYTSTTKAGETFRGTFAASIVFVFSEGEWKVLHLHESLPNVPQ